MPDPWLSGEPYEAFMGRWSRPVAERFLRWLALPNAAIRWLDVGCGTGVLSAEIAAQADPDFVFGLDFSAPFIIHARRRHPGRPYAFAVSDAADLPLADNSMDAAVSGLALNFFPRPERALAEMARVVRSGGTVAAYVWDYAEGMQMLRFFWDTAVALDPAAAALDEGRRFPICRPQPLMALFDRAGLKEVRTQAIEVPTGFVDFDDFWQPLLGGVGPVPGYIAGLTKASRAELQARLQERLTLAADGSITLQARAWAVRGRGA